MYLLKDAVMALRRVMALSEAVTIPLRASRVVRNREAGL